MEKILVNIPYLEGSDVLPDGSLKPTVGKGRPVVVMLQGNFCGYCTQSKPAFQAIANNPFFAVATVQTDGGEADRSASAVLGKFNSSGGVPAFLGFDKDGKFKVQHQGSRDSESLMQFGKSL